MCGLINLELAPSQERFPLKSAERISSPLVGPNPLQVEGVVAPPGCSGRPWADHLQPAQQKPCLGPHLHHRESPPQERGGYGQSTYFLFSPPSHLLGNVRILRLGTFKRPPLPYSNNIVVMGWSICLLLTGLKIHFSYRTGLLLMIGVSRSCQI